MRFSSSWKTKRVKFTITRNSTPYLYFFRRGAVKLINVSFLKYQPSSSIFSCYSEFGSQNLLFWKTLGSNSFLTMFHLTLRSDKPTLTILMIHSPLYKMPFKVAVLNFSTKPESRHVFELFPNLNVTTGRMRKSLKNELNHDLSRYSKWAWHFFLGRPGEFCW